MADVKIRILGDSSNAQRAFRTAERDADSFQQRAQNVGRRMTAVGAGMTAALTMPIVALFGTGMSEILEWDQAMRQSEAVVRSTGGAANVTAAEMGAYAEQMQAATGIQDDLILSGENVMATFTNVRNVAGADIFTQANESALDLSIALGTDLQSATTMVGKALNDPISGLTSLTRAGIQFTDQQKEQIRIMVEAGDVAGAQQLILGELETQFGGSAEAYGESGAGKIERFKRALEGFAESMTTVLMPAIEPLADGAERVATWLGNLSGRGQTVAAVLLVAAAAAGPLLMVMGALVTAIGVISLPILALVAAVALFAGAWILAYTKVEWFRSAVDAYVDFLISVLWPAIQQTAQVIIQKFGEIVAWVQANWPAIQEAIGHVMNVIRMHVSAVVSAVQMIWNTFGQNILTAAQTVWSFISTTIQNAVRMVQQVIQLVLNVINGDWGAAWNNIKNIAGIVWNQIGNVVRTAINLLRNVVNAGINGVKALWSAGWNAMKTAVGTIWNGIKSTVSSGVSSLIGFVRGIPGSIASVVSGAFDSIPRAFKSAINNVISAWNNISIGGFHVDLPFGQSFDAPAINFPNIPMLAKGGNITAAGWTMVGERGPEFLRLPKGAEVRPLDSGAGSTYNFENHFHDAQPDPAKLSRELAWMLRTSAY
jgi:phage-related protein